MVPSSDLYLCDRNLRRLYFSLFGLYVDIFPLSIMNAHRQMYITEYTFDLWEASDDDLFKKACILDEEPTCPTTWPWFNKLLHSVN